MVNEVGVCPHAYQEHSYDGARMSAPSAPHFGNLVSNLQSREHSMNFDLHCSVGSFSCTRAIIGVSLVGVAIFLFSRARWRAELPSGVVALMSAPYPTRHSMECVEPLRAARWRAVR